MIYEKMTFVNSIYGLMSKGVAYAVSNQLYDTALFERTIIAAKGTYMEKVVMKYGIEFSVDVKTDDIYVCIIRFVESYDLEEFTSKCVRFWVMLEGM